ncbi:MAG: RtcB family protein [Verrucomicrobia bacterium]|nr:RtcB family protein [Verrucomicrobiota bacterium]MBI3868588.1 RtcB family protein [Verrucomicrobiota bacterium]
MTLGMDFIARYVLKGLDRSLLERELAEIVREPSRFVADELRGPFAQALMRAPPPLRPASAPWRQWGDGLEPNAVDQLARACTLPVAAAGALMPDAHVGYGLPIGGVLATEGAVIPYAVGVDIACRMKMTVLDLPLRELERQRQRLIEAVEAETRFGIGAAFRERREHPVLEADWNVSPITRQNKDRAWSQLGTSGSGNHFVEFGVFSTDHPIKGLQAGDYVALLSHSGSRGSGAAVCDHYSKLAMAEHPELPKQLKHLAWLSLESEVGQEYWAAMELMGRYAAANHALIHRHIAEHLRVAVLLDVENHHNFAWKERHRIDGVEREVVVHRKGATPAGAGVLGIIPGSMASPGFLVRGKGNPDSLNSASHGAGRVMSRSRALDTFEWSKVNRVLKDRGVHLISAGLDEVPMVYKDIHQVMAAQADLVEILGRFDPKLVKMAPSGERPED